MQRRLFEPSLATWISVVLATISLAACGPGASGTTTASVPDTVSAQSPARDAAADQQPAAAPRSSAALASQIGTAAPTDAASFAYANDPVQSVQASLAADSQQVAPVMSYAPGDEPPASSHSSSTATTRQ
ncbi:MULTISPECIES: hypothetical protein [unclassified Paraburkholderia]|uniref:hypothetical protein n=1 Tax=unclassified Paraburkholderia TaxID=2615204 RepID=UPI002AB29726|nr:MULTISPECIES: hypothetical protein [unclassified Paraburkholderia]